MTERKTITDTTCKNVKPCDAKYEIDDGTRIGFRLLVQPSGAKSLIFRYTSPEGVYSNSDIRRKYTPNTNALAAALERYTKALDALARKLDVKITQKSEARCRQYCDRARGTLQEGEGAGLVREYAVCCRPRTGASN